MDTATYLKHYGVKGMKWGVRKNPNYTDAQRQRDREVYGKRGERRIDRQLNSGASIAGARSVEKTRRDTTMGRNKYVRQGGKMAGAAAGAYLGMKTANLAAHLIEYPHISKKVNDFIGTTLGDELAYRLSTGVAKPFIAYGMASIGYMASGDLAVAANMRLAGYNPSRKK